MASNYVDTTGEEGRFHGPHHSSSTTPTGAAASSPRTMRRSFSSASSAGSHGGGGAAPKCVCAPATHAGSFKCRLHRTNSQGHGHPHPSPPASPASAAPPQGVPSSASSHTVEAQ
ncbi:uncharacterized protein LOC133922063 [Phragmites australis]|uniref:uncharacterized protein LOC133922063 n=1 Tax=Phragmites australis TaxID=29695 RepID=UPI002D772CD8|nr:uncharacterized protein LOC133922063 [Phragmites australis]